MKQSLREYGVDDITTFDLLAKLIKCYERAEDRESIDSVVVNIIEFEKRL